MYRVKTQKRKRDQIKLDFQAHLSVSKQKACQNML